MKAMLIVLVMLILVGTARAAVTNESEAGIASANGNTKTQSLNFKQANTYVWRDNTLGFKGRYLNAKADGVETARYLEGNLRYERRLANHFNMYVGELYQQDRFAGYQNRYSSDIGGKYFYIQSETTKFFSELGYRYMKEEHYKINGNRPSDISNSMGRFYTEWETKWNESFTTKWWGEYIPNFTDPKDWLANSELSVSAMLTQVFSLKTGILMRYDHSPATGIAYKTDTLFTTALVAKF